VTCYRSKSPTPISGKSNFLRVFLNAFYYRHKDSLHRLIAELFYPNKEIRSRKNNKQKVRDNMEIISVVVSNAIARPAVSRAVT